MADKDQVALLKQGAEVWNGWREKNPKIIYDLNGAYLNAADLNGETLVGADLRRADLRNADLGGTNLSGAKLTKANLTKATLIGTNLSGADLIEATLIWANLVGADLSGADLSEATLIETVFGNTDLSNVKGLDSCIHFGPSVMDHRTLQRSGPLPLTFLRDCGLPERLIDNLPSILEQAIQFYSVFISYSSRDQEFANRLHADLQNKDVRCWFARHDMKTGDRIRDIIDVQIRVREKLLVVLSSASIESEWVEDEVEAALEEERKSGNRRTVLFPIQIDDAVKNTTRAWAGKIRRTRHIT